MFTRVGGVARRSDGLLSRLLKLKVYMVEIAALISIAMLLVWSLWTEFRHLFK